MRRAWERLWFDDRDTIVEQRVAKPAVDLANHIGQMMAADFFVVPTATCRLVFVLVILLKS